MAHLARGLLEVLQDDELNERQQQWQAMMGCGGPHVGPHSGQMGLGCQTGPQWQMIGGPPQPMGLQPHGMLPRPAMLVPGPVMDPRRIPMPVPGVAIPMPVPGHVGPQQPRSMMAGPPGGPGFCPTHGAPAAGERVVTPIVTEMPSPEPAHL